MKAFLELRRLAAHYMKRERIGHTLQATALVNEAYLRLIEVPQVRWQNRTHFFAMAARLMRPILVDAERSRGYQKRGAARSYFHSTMRSSFRPSLQTTWWRSTTR
jgi:RNA polymerase sigma factor (TIGR02999 family)